MISKEFKNFDLYAKDHKISSLDLHYYNKQIENNLTPYILEERQLNVTAHPTSQLNRILEQANKAHSPPPVAGRRLRLKFVNQSDVFPPTFTFHGNHVDSVPSSYERFLKNFFITSLKLTNTPVKIQYKSGENPFKDRKNILSARQVQKKKRLMRFVKKK